MTKRTNNDKVLETKAGKCLTRLQKLIPKPEAHFVALDAECGDNEMYSLELDFAIQGAWLNKDGRSLRIYIVIERWEPEDVDPDMGVIQRMARKKIEEELAWLKGVPSRITVDRASLKDVQKTSRINRIAMSITGPICKGEVSQEDVAEILSELLAQFRPELRDVLVVKDTDDNRPPIHIEGRGLPCPLCMGHLSEDTILGLFHRIRMDRFSREMEDD
jgi:hypothetical protein